MFTSRWRRCSWLIPFALLLAACQPIQPATSEAAAASPAEATGLPPLVQATYPTAGLRVGLPEGWPIWYEAGDGALGAASAIPPGEPQESNEWWSYLMEEPIVYVVFANMPFDEAQGGDLGQLLVEHYATTRSSNNHVHPVDRMTVVEGPTEETINGQRAARAIMAGTDTVLRQPFNSHVWAIQNADRVVFMASSLLEQNEAAFAPIVEAIASSVEVSAPAVLASPQVEVTGEIAPGETMAGTLDVARPDKMERDYWHFVAEEGKRYNITLTPLTPYTDIVGDVVDADGESLIGYEYDNFFNDQAEEFMYVASEGGDRYIVVRNYLQDPGDYSVRLEEAE